MYFGLPRERMRAAGAVLSLKGSLFDYLKSVEYTDPAAGSSDEITVVLYNCDLEWLKDKAPESGDQITGALTLTNWNGVGDNRTVKAGSFTVDDISYDGVTSECEILGVSKPADSSWQTRERTQVWEDITIDGIAGELAGRNGLSLEYNAPTINIKKIEQSQKSDQSFLETLCEDHDLGMKVFEKKLVIFDWGRMEEQGSVATLKIEDLDGSYSYHDTIAGIYTGAEIAYKNADDDKEIKVTVGDAKRQLYLNDTADTAAEAEKIAKSKVNESNRGMTTFDCDIWPRDDIVSGVTVDIEGFGVADGKYFVDKMTFAITNSGTKQSLEMHKCQPRL